MRINITTLLTVLTAFCLSLPLTAQNYTKYLFAYFPSNSNENVYYALSDKESPFDFVPMNYGQMIVSADSVALKRGVRDPHMLRGEDGWFYMVCTDMRCAEGWDSNPAQYANNNQGRGWEWRYVPFTVTDSTPVEIAFTGSVENCLNQWMSFTSISLLNRPFSSISLPESRATHNKYRKVITSDKKLQRDAFTLDGRKATHNSGRVVITTYQ